MARPDHKESIGIDLGTCNSCVAAFSGGVSRALVNQQSGQLTTPTVIDFQKNVIGEAARQQQGSGNTIYSFKRLIGRRFTDVEVQEQIKKVDYKLIERNEDVIVQLKDTPLPVPGNPNNSRELSVSQVAAAYLIGLQKATGFSGRDVVLTVPAYYTHRQKLETSNAGEQAGLNVLRLLAEPTAAALQYNQGLPSSAIGDSEQLAVVDLGAGTLDVSILDRQGDVYQVLAASGNNYYGGDDYTAALTRYFSEQHSIQLSKPSTERVKHFLSKQMSGMHRDVIELALEAVSDQKGVLNVKLSDIDALYKPLDEKLTKPILQALSDAGLRPAQLSKVILVGGQTKQPSVRKHLEQLLGKAPVSAVDPDVSVAQGASIQAGILAGKTSSVLLLDATPFSLGIETLGGVFSRILGRNVTLPAKASQIFTTTEDNQESVVIRIYQGEHQLASQNVFLDEFILPVEPGQPRGKPRLRVEFAVDQDGIVHVTAQDERTGKAKDVRVRCQRQVESENNISDATDLERQGLIAAIKAAGEMPKGNETLEALRAWKARIRRRQKK